MKRYPFLSILFLAVLSVVVLATKCKKDPPPPPDEPEPPITCTSNIQDGCLDDWKVYHTSTGDYINPAAGFLQTLNELASVPPAAGGPGPVTVDTVTDCVQGKYAARCVSKYFYIVSGSISDTVFIPGYVGASVLDIGNQTIYLGKPYTSKPKRFQGYFKYAPVAGDSALIQVMLSRFASGKRDTISYNKVILKNPVPSYTQIDFPLAYRDTVHTPDTLILIFAASAKINFNDVFHCGGREGSTLWVDDLKFVMP